MMISVFSSFRCLLPLVLSGLSLHAADTSLPPYVFRPITPTSEASAAQILGVVSRLARNDAPVVLDQVRLDGVQAGLLPARPESATAKLRREPQPENYAGSRLRVTREGFWLIGEEAILHSADGASWRVAYQGELKPIDLIELGEKTFLLGPNWLFEVDGRTLEPKRLLAHFGESAVMDRNLAAMSGRAVSRSDFVGLQPGVVWGDSYYFSNGDGILFDFGATGMITRGGEDGPAFEDPPLLLVAEQGLIAQGRPRSDGPYRSAPVKSWIFERFKGWRDLGAAFQPLHELPPWKLLSARGRLLRAPFRVGVSTDGVIFEHSITALQIIVAADGQGKSTSGSVIGRWDALALAGDMFVAFMHFEEAGVSRWAFATSYDGHHWKWFVLPEQNGVNFGKNTTQLVVKGDTLVAIDLRGRSYATARIVARPDEAAMKAEGHPALATGAQALAAQFRTAEQARDAQGMIARLAELDFFYPSAQVRFAVANQKVQLGAFDSAMSDLDQLAEADPSNPVYDFARWKVLVQAQNGAAAEWLEWANAKIDAAVAAAPGDLALREKRFQARVESGNQAGALEDIRALATGAPDNPQVRMLAGQFEFQAGNHAAARSHLQRAAELGHPEAQAMLQRVPANDTAPSTKRGTAP
ncbi:MAG TPA: hypothetical protein VGD88_12690 [Opitutaceae bacterium]